MRKKFIDGSSKPGSRRPITKVKELRRALPQTSTRQALLVALILGLVGGALVSGTFGLLEPVHRANQARDQQKYLLDIVRRQPGMEQLLGAVDAEQMEAMVIDLTEGKPLESIDAGQFNQDAAAKDPDQQVPITPENDIAFIKNREKLVKIYHVKYNDELKMIILPVYGKGFVSTIRGYIALAPDANTVLALSFYDHAETPGLGARIGDPKWLQQWQGKKIRDAEGTLRITIARGRVPESSPAAPYEVDGLTGATWTARSVANILRFWLGDDGFGAYLKTLRNPSGAAAPMPETNDQ